MKDRSNYRSTRGSYQRAVRFPIQNEIHYGPDGTEDRETGAIQYISRSGVLFNASELLAVNTAPDLSFPFPAKSGSKAGPIVLGRGHIVRTILPPTSDQLDLMAVGFSDCRLRFSGDETPEHC